MCSSSPGIWLARVHGTSYYCRPITYVVVDGAQCCLFGKVPTSNIAALVRESRQRSLTGTSAPFAGVKFQETNGRFMCLKTSRMGHVPKCESAPLRSMGEVGGCYAHEIDPDLAASVWFDLH